MVNDKIVKWILIIGLVLFVGYIVSQSSDDIPDSNDETFTQDGKTFFSVAGDPSSLPSPSAGVSSNGGDGE